MSRMPVRGLLCVVALALALPNTWPTVHAKPIPPTSQEDLAQVWIGLTEDELKIFRITLDSTGGGIVGFVYLDNEPEIHEIASWTNKGQRLKLRTNPPPGSASGPLELEGTALGSAIELVVRTPGWKRRLSLRPEAELEQRWNRLRAAMKREGN